jgi:hypothetical protein
MTDPNQRRMNWQIKTDTGKVKAILDDKRPDMLTTRLRWPTSARWK